MDGWLGKLMRSSRGVMEGRKRGTGDFFYRTFNSSKNQYFFYMARTGFASFHSKCLAHCVFLEPFSREFGSIGKSCK